MPFRVWFNTFGHMKELVGVAGTFHSFRGAEEELDQKFLWLQKNTSLLKGFTCGRSGARCTSRRPVFFGNAGYTESRPALRLPFALGLIGGGFPLRPLGGFQALL